MFQALLHKIIKSGLSKGKWAAGLLVLGIAFLLILLSIQLYVNYQDLLTGKHNNQQAEDFLVISKEVSNQMMSNKQSGLLTEADLAAVQKMSGVTKVAPVISNRFRATAEGFTDALPFYSDIFFQSVPDAFIDVRSEEWTWKEGETSIPIIIPNAWLDLYNTGMAFTRSDLPQLSAESIKALPFKIKVYGKAGPMELMGHVMGFSDRLNSILVPQSFMDFANTNFGYQALNGYTSAVVKTKDPSDPALIAAFEKSSFRFDKEKTRFSQYREIVNKVVPSIGVIGLLMLLFGIMVFSLFVQITISNSKQDIALLTTVGASPSQLEKFLMRRFLPPNLYVIAAALLCTMALQWLAWQWLKPQNIFVSPLVSWWVLAAALLLAAILFWGLRKNIRQYLYVK
jgi:cell division protein FtsX